MAHPNITYVDKNDNVIGAGPRLEAYEKGIIHRIVRIFIVNSSEEILIQKRSPNIFLPGKWDQSAAGHVDEGEDYATAAYRETSEEVGIEGIKLKEIKKYYIEETDEIHRKRFNMLYAGTYDGEIKPDPEEVSEIKWILPDKLGKWMNEKPEDFTQGFIKCFEIWRNEI